MPTVALTKVAGTVSLSSEWVTIEDDGRVNIQHAVAPGLAGPGIEITKIQITGRVRNSSSAVKNLRLGFKPALSSGRDTWAAFDGNSVLDSTFQAIGGSSNGSYIYQTFTRTYDAATNSAAFAKFAGHIRESFINGTPVYLGIIQPTASRSISVYISGYWTITVTYDILGNVPTTDVNEAVIGSTSITTTIEKVVPGSVTKLRYKVGDMVLRTVDLTTEGSHVYTPPTSAGAHFPNDLTGELTVEAETFLNSVTYGTVRTDVTLKLPANAPPTCVCAPEQLARVIPGVDAYVQGKSGVKFSVSGTANYGASIAGYELAFDGGEYDTFPKTISTLTNSGTRPFTLTVTDSRGLTGTHTGSIFVHALQLPKIIAFACARSASDGTIDDDAECVKYVLAASVSPLSVNGVERNTLMYHIKSRPVNTEAWQTNDDQFAAPSAVSVSDEGMIEKNGVIATYTAFQGYDFVVEVVDLFGTSVANYTIPTNQRQFVLGHDGKSVSFGGAITGTAAAPNAAFHHPAVFLGGIPQLGWSTDEVDTGTTWIDGKRLYAKTVVLTGTSQPSIASIVDIAETVLLGRCCSVTTYSSKRYVSNSFYASSSDNARVFLNLSDKVARATFGSGHSNQVSYIEILYTKK